MVIMKTAGNNHWPNSVLLPLANMSGSKLKQRALLFEFLPTTLNASASQNFIPSLYLLDRLSPLYLADPQ